MRKRLFANPWRLAFLILLTLVAVAVIALWMFYVSITKPLQRTDTPAAPPAQGQTVPVQATISLDAINRYVDLLLQGKETPVKDAKINFEGQRVRVDSSLTFFGRMMDMSIWMRPEVQANGDLKLVAEEAKMGNWPIPLRTLFAVLEGLPWPPWVHAHADQRSIDFLLSERQASGYSYRIKKIDFEKKVILLDIELSR